MDREVLYNITKRDKLERRHLWLKYKQQRNFTTNFIKKKKRSYIANVLSDSNGKQTKDLRPTLKNNHKTKQSPKPSKHDNAPPNDQATANELNKYFTNIGSCLSPTYDLPKYSETKPLSYITKLSNVPLLSVFETIRFLKEITVTKDSGSDSLFIRVLRLALPYICTPITDIINRCIEEKNLSSTVEVCIGPSLV